MDRTEHNEILNRTRIEYFLNKGLEKMHHIFRDRWLIYKNGLFPSGTNNHWNDDAICKGELLKLKLFKLSSKMRGALKNEKLDLWDITLTNRAIDAVSKENKKNGVSVDKQEDEMIKDLRDIRNVIAHKKFNLSDHEYTDYCDRLTKIMIDAGDNLKDTEAFKESLKEIWQIKDEVKNDHTKFAELKEVANNLFKAKKYDQAIGAYTKILDLSGLSPENQAVIYSNRSIAYLKLENQDSLLMAKRDAEWAIKLWPCLWRAYYNLGQAQIKLDEWNEAEESFNKALALNMKSKEVLDKLSEVRSHLGVISRRDHFNPRLWPQSMEEMNKELNKLNISDEKSDKVLELLLKSNIANVIKGHQYQEGMGNIKQDYGLAAKHYTKAAVDGIPEGMYNLALLYKNGKGVQRDYEQYAYWLKKAANTKPPHIMLAIGVSEAQHSLGLMYFEGIGVTRDFIEAAKWYEKAAMNGFGPSANNLGLLFKNGQGVEKSYTKALEYFKLAAEKGDVPSMRNLAECYFNAEGTGSPLVPKEEDIAGGKKWLKIAKEKGDMVAAQELERIEDISLKDFRNVIASQIMDPDIVLGADPLDEAQYGKYVRKAAKKGSQTAKQVIEIWNHMNDAMEAFKKNDSAAVCDSLTKACRIKFQIVKIPQFYYSLIEERHKTHPHDIDVIICFLQLRRRNLNVGTLIDFFLTKFISDEYLLELRINSFLGIKEYKEGIDMVNAVLNVFPTSIRFLYWRAVILARQNPQNEELVEAFDKFLALAPEDHEKVPVGHYYKAQYYFFTRNFPMFTQTFGTGLASEKLQLPCFLPYVFEPKGMMEKAYLPLKTHLASNNGIRRR